jgi:hypothetical protein
LSLKKGNDGKGFAFALLRLMTVIGALASFFYDTVEVFLWSIIRGGGDSSFF